LDGRRLSLGRDDGRVLVYETACWTEVARLKVDFSANYLASHPEGNRLAVGGGGTVGVWEVATGKLLWRVSTPQPNPVAWHPDGDLLATGSGDGGDTNVRLWDGATGRPHAVLGGHQNNGIEVAFAAGGDLLVTSAWDGTTRLWDPWMGRELLRFTGGAR